MRLFLVVTGLGLGLWGRVRGMMLTLGLGLANNSLD